MVTSIAVLYDLEKPDNFVESVKNNVRPPLDVYDCATMRVITPLSESSIKNNGAPQKFPDFTKGKWRIRKNNFCVKKDY